MKDIEPSIIRISVSSARATKIALVNNSLALVKSKPVPISNAKRFNANEVIRENPGELKFTLK